MMCVNFVYKRRKLRNSVALLSKENIVESSRPPNDCNSSFSFDNVTYLLSMKKTELETIKSTMNASVDELEHGSNPSNGRNLPISLPPNTQPESNVVLALASLTEGSFPDPKRRVHRQNSHVDRLTPDHNPIANGRCSSSESDLEKLPDLTKNGEEDVCECSSSGVKNLAQQADCHASKEFCINVLTSSGLIGGSWPINNDHSLDILGGNDDGSFQQCNVCGLMEILQKMLICDLCEGAFHMSCCQVKESSTDEWYCQPCHSKKPRPLLDVAAGKLFPLVGEEYKRRILQQELGPIQFMLVDPKPYTSGVRIGREFQVEVPEWSDPISDDYDHFDETMELNIDYGSMKVIHYCQEWNSIKSSKTSSIGNWLQCQEVIYNGQNEDGVVCGKWRRAPLFATQTDDWDCSCSVVWDPYHADCAVPQELETDEVLKHLKYVELLKTRLNKKRKSG